MDWDKFHITDGTGQQDRVQDALETGTFDVDEHSFEDLLAMAAEIAAQMKYYDLRNRVDGDWGALFGADEAVVMATIVSIDPKRIEAEFFGIPFSHSVQLLQFMLGLARRVNRWLLQLSASKHESGVLLASRLETLIADKLAPELHSILGLEQATGIPWVEQQATRFATAWGLDSPTGGGPRSRARREPPDRGEDIKGSLGKSFYVFLNAITYLKGAAAEGLKQSLTSEQHEPAVGLVIVFLQLYQKAQRRLNRFTLRHLDFYYRKILKAQNKPREAKSCYLLLQSLAAGGRLVIEQGTEFSAGQDADFDDIVYQAAEALPLGDTRVAALASLHLQRDELMAPEYELDFVTRIKAQWPPLAERAAGSQAVAPWPLFGAERRGEAGGGADDARIGFGIASPVLLLEQGRRNIEITVSFEAPAKTWLDKQLRRLQKCKSARVFRRRFGVLFTRHLLSYEGCIDRRQRRQIVAAARTCGAAKNLAHEVSYLLKQNWHGLFYKLFKNALQVELTTRDGWLEAGDCYLQPLSGARRRDCGFRLTLNLGAGVAPICAYDAAVHGGELQTQAPVLRCQVNALSNFFVYSLFRDLRIDSIHIDVDVSGVNNLLLYNQHGQLDPSKPFQPYGPLPGGSSYFVFGNYEIARKQLSALSIDLDWAELPPLAGGFDEFYLGYDTRYRNNSFQADFTALVDGRWAPDERLDNMPVGLFDTVARGNRVAAHKKISVTGLGFTRPLAAGVEESAYRYDHNASNGFYRLQLAAPESGFGHGEYAQLLTRVLSENARRRKPKPVPNAPYTPTLSGISLSYRARASIFPSRVNAAAEQAAEKVFHLHPFGAETVFPPAPDGGCYLLPRYLQEGNLFIGLQGENPQGELSLLFHLARDHARAGAAAPEKLNWYYMAQNRWHPFKTRQLLADGTYGFQVSGIVSLNIPAEISNDNTVMPAGCYWLRVSTGRDAASFPSCYSVQPHAVKVTRAPRQASLPEYDPAADTSWAPLAPIPGIGGITQAFEAFGGRDAESDSGLRQRISERLRHKNRALMPWDYEQLILERFPEIQKVKCFNGIDSEGDRIEAGKVLIVVVPDARRQPDGGCALQMIGKRKLGQIRRYVKNRASYFAKIRVRNPQYERVQVRCTVKFTDAARAGVYVRRLDRAISDYICPWKPVGYRVRFGWSIRQQDIESYILNLGYVEMVTNFSMLHITVDNDGYYRLFDTADRAHDGEAVVRPRYPWGLALPMESHFIETTLLDRPVKPEVTGIDELAVDGTFIIGGSNNND